MRGPYTLQTKLAGLLPVRAIPLQEFLPDDVSLGT